MYKSECSQIAVRFKAYLKLRYSDLEVNYCLKVKI